METQIQYDLSDIQNALRLHIRPYAAAKRFRWLFFASLVILGTSLIHLLNQGNVLYEGGFITFCMIMLLVLYEYVGLRFMARRIQSKTIPFQILLDDSGITTTTTYDKSHQSWTKYTEWKEDPHGFLLYSSGNSYANFPKRFVEKPELIKEYLLDNDVPEHNSRQEIISYLGFFLISIFIALRVFVL